MFIPVTTIVVSLGLALLATVLMAKGGPRNGLFLVAIGFLLFAYGPAVNILIGGTYYSGINIRTIAAPVFGFGLAMAALLLAHKIVPPSIRQQAPTNSRDYLLLPWLLAACAAWGAFVLATGLVGTLGANKLVQVAAAGPWHYPYLLLQILAVSTHFMCRTRLSRRVWLLNAVVYVAYALATSERDFLFVLAAVLVHREVFIDKNRSARIVILGGAAAVGGTLLATGRQATGEGSLLSSILNQGSVLFIDSNLHRWVPAMVPHERGGTYLDAILRPFGLTDSPSLADWFVSIYAPNSPSGYGFSLTGEAFLNFGLYGVPVVFLLLALTQRGLMNRAGRSDLSCYLSVVFLATWLYALRGDFSQLFTTMLYAVVLFGGLALVRLDMTKLSQARQPATHR